MPPRQRQQQRPAQVMRRSIPSPCLALISKGPRGSRGTSGGKPGKCGGCAGTGEGGGGALGSGEDGGFAGYGGGSDGRGRAGTGEGSGGALGGGEDGGIAGDGGGNDGGGSAGIGEGGGNDGGNDGGGRTGTGEGGGGVPGGGEDGGASGDGGGNNGGGCAGIGEGGGGVLGGGEDGGTAGGGGGNTGGNDGGGEGGDLLGGTQRSSSSVEAAAERWSPEVGTCRERRHKPSSLSFVRHRFKSPSARLRSRHCCGRQLDPCSSVRRLRLELLRGPPPDPKRPCPPGRRVGAHTPVRPRCRRRGPTSGRCMPGGMGSPRARTRASGHRPNRSDRLCRRRSAQRLQACWPPPTTPRPSSRPERSRSTPHNPN
eukprot:319263-Prymnesium_polylepis.3